MANDSIYEELPADPEEAFLLLEEEFRNECTSRLGNAHQEDDVKPFYTDYIAQVTGAIHALGLEAKFAGDVPSIQDIDYYTYSNFSKDVKYYITTLAIRHGRRKQGFSIKFDDSTKKKIRHHLKNIRDIIGKTEIDASKKETLLSKISGFEQELDRERTRLEAYGNLVIEAAGVLGDATDKLEPVRKWLDTIGRLIWGAKQDDQAKQLPPPEEQKKIEPPRNASANRDITDDDDIPF